jgi:hypothetical protein
MSDRAWGHCRHCKFFASPSRMPLEDEEAACQHSELSKFELRVFGASGCNGFELRPGLAESEERPGLLT